MLDTLLDNALDALVNATPVPTFVINANHCVRHWNRACEQILGYPASALLGTTDQWKPFYARRRPTMADLVVSGCIDNLIGNYYDAKKYRPSRTLPGSYEAEDFFPHLGKDGLWFYFTAAPIRDSAGRLIGAVETLQDITERKRSEEAHRLSEERLRATVENTPNVMILWLDEAQRIVFANHATADLLGRHPDDLLGATPGEAGLLVGAAQSALDEVLADIRRRELPSAPREVQACAGDGSSRILLVHAYAIPASANGAQFALVATDVTAARQAESALRREHLRLKTIIDHFPGGITLMDEQLRVVEHNAEFLRLLDFPPALFAAGAPTLDELLRFNARRGEYGAGDQEQQVRGVLAAANHAQPHAFERVRPNGTVLEVRGTPLPHGGFVTSYTDVSWRKDTERKLKELLDEHRVIFDNAHVGIAYIEGRTILNCNQRMAEIFGFNGPEEMIGRRTWVYYPSRERWKEHGEKLYHNLATRGYSESEVQLQRQDGSSVWCYQLGRPLDPKAPHAGSIWVYSDITRHKEAEERVHFLAHHDALTGLPNRGTLQDRFARSARRAANSGKQLALLFLDMDQFKRVNDSLGHRTGDALLVSAVNRLRECLREGDTISRQGGDEFVVLLEDVRSRDDVAVVARKLIACMEPAFDIGEHSLSTSFSIGIAMFPQNGRDFDTLLQQADTAMYHAKEGGRCTFSFFDEQMNLEASERLALHGRLRQALARGELHLAYQPQALIRSGRIVGAEALLRWSPADMAAVPPDRFIPIAEESGLILPIGEWVIHQAFRQARAWRDAGHPLRISINVSGLQVYRTDLRGTLAAAQRDTGLAPGMVEIELTESSLMEDVDAAREVLGQLKAAGYSVAIDDFGTGYSSLAYLKKFSLDKLKIDRSFVTDLCENAEDRTIARAVIQIARSLHLRVIAEGVETAEQLAFLKRNGCHEAQGYFIGRPGAAADITTLLGAARR